MKKIHGAESFCLETEFVDVAVTETGGQLTASFRLGEREVRPYALSPWEPADYPDLPVLLSHLRGDFFCLPFGGQDEGPPHGEPANALWKKSETEDAATLSLRMETMDSGAVVEKKISVGPGETAIYISHEVSGLRGAFSYGSHAILDASALAEGQARVSISPFRWGSVDQAVFSDPKNKEYQALKQGAEFTDLRAVPKSDGDFADLTRWPARRGFDDLVMMVSEEGEKNEIPFAWTAIVLDGYLWFCLKNPRDFPATLFWMSNGGRHSSPWNGRHLSRIGLEEVCSYFADGLNKSRENLLTDQKIPTVRHFSGSPVRLPLIQAVVAVPKHFDLVKSITPMDDGTVTILAESGAIVETALNWRFVVG